MVVAYLFRCNATGSNIEEINIDIDDPFAEDRPSCNVAYTD